MCEGNVRVAYYGLDVCDVDDRSDAGTGVIFSVERKGYMMVKWVYAELSARMYLVEMCCSSGMWRLWMVGMGGNDDDGICYDVEDCLRYGDVV